MAELNIDGEKFIEDIRNKPEIWDRNCLSSKQETDIAWKELMEMYQMPVSILKAKWKSIRDMFRIELRKLPRNELDEVLIRPYDFQSNYPFYKQLQFLSEHMRFRAPFRVQQQDSLATNFSNFSGSLEAYQESTVSDDNNDDTGNESMLERLASYKPGSIFEPIVEHHIPSSHKTYEQLAQQTKAQNIQISSSTKRKRSTFTPGEIIDVDSDSSSGIGGERRKKDSDYHFLMSLHPYMLELNATQKLRIRNKIQKLIFKELYDAGDEDI